MRCPACGGETPAGKRFCKNCGGSLAAICEACGAQLESDNRFCVDCGTPIGATVSEPSTAALLTAKPPEPPTTELRHVSVLFCDLVGFTPFSEKRDPEEVREVLSGYFELARAIVGRYGGVVQKFIGDAVMAVWGAPLAREDDAERAVRAALELTSAVAAYGSEHGTQLQARVGVVTGGAATTETPEEGLVIGDRVNTAARIQSAAPPGCCYVDETTRAASAAAIAYTETGEHNLKGKSEPVRLFQATRVVAATAGSQRASVLEAPFTGRDHELRLVKELFHTSAERHSARLVLVTGVAGIGKSRLAWEFFKYIDGLAGEVLWHSGHCLSYGDGVSYWALSEMVRARLQIGEEDPLEAAAERLTSGLERWIPNASDREFILPRLAQLLGVPTAQSLSREELFSGWRLFFERLAEHLPVVIVVEDLQWADSGMVDFLDYLLDWSADHAIFLLVLTRPEGADQGGLVLSRRNLTTLSLDALSDDVIGQLLDGLVADLPETPRARIVGRAEGIPLYAIETVRSLLDRGGVLEKDEDGLLHLVGELGELEIPPGLTALIASRLDALAAEERRVVKECAVLGESFPRQAIEAVSDADRGELDEILISLVRKEVLTVRADKLSPERGQYAFTQSLIRSVAYDMLTRAERKSRHLATATHLRNAFPDDGAEVVEVIAAHLHDAFKAAGDDPDAQELRTLAKDAYVRAGERAESVGAPEASESAYLTASELSSHDEERTRLIEKSAEMAALIGADERALERFEAAVAAHLKAGRVVDAARLTAAIGTLITRANKSAQAVERLRKALSSLDPESAPPAVVALLEERLGRALVYAGHVDQAAEPIERALTLAQHHELTETYALALQIKAYLYAAAGRVEESILNQEASLEVARKHGLVQVEARSQNLLTDLCMIYDRRGAEEHALSGLALARRQGARSGEVNTVGNLMYVLMLAGRWDEASRFAAEVFSSAGEASDVSLIHFREAFLDSLRGAVTSARQHFAFCESWRDVDDVQARGMYRTGLSAIAIASGQHRVALEAATAAVQGAIADGLPLAHEIVRLSFSDAVDAAMATGDLEAADRLLGLFTDRAPGEVPPFLRAQVTRAKALVACARGEGDVETDLVSVETAFRDLGYPYWEARAQLDRAEWLARTGRFEEAATLASQAVTTFETVGAQPMVARARVLFELEKVRAPAAMRSALS